jgi:hypothetical protein
MRGPNTNDVYTSLLLGFLSFIRRKEQNCSVYMHRFSMKTLDFSFSQTHLNWRNNIVQKKLFENVR